MGGNEEEDTEELVEMAAEEYYRTLYLKVDKRKLVKWGKSSLALSLYSIPSMKNGQKGIKCLSYTY